MKRLAFLSFTIATLIAPIQVQAQQYDPVRNCIRFPQKSNPEAELQYLLAYPNATVCPSPSSGLAGQAKDPGLAGQAEAFRGGLIDSTNITIGRIQNPYR